MRHGYVTVDGIRTHYIEAGSGRPVVLLHSGEFGGCAELSWEHTIPALARDYRVIAPDWLGFGLTDKVHDFVSGHRRRVVHITGFLDALGITGAAFVGNSMGGSLLARVAATEAPEWPIEAMVLASGGGFAPDNEHRRVLLEYDCTLDAMRRIHEVIFHDPRFAADEEHVRRRYESSLVPGAWECASAARFKSPVAPARSDFGVPDKTPYEAIAVPTLVIAGAEDVLRLPHYADELAERIPDARLEVYEGCGHMPNVELADRFNADVARFLHEVYPALTEVTSPRTLVTDAVRPRPVETAPPMSGSHDTPLDLAVREIGSGPPLLFLHGWSGSDGTDALLQRLARDFSVLAPSHPGFDGSARPVWLTGVDDLAYLYLDLLAERGLRDVAVLGVSLGGWVAAEMAVRSQERLGALVLADAIGLRVGGVEDRDITDIYALSREDVHAHVYHDPDRIPLGIESRDDAELRRLAGNEETAALLLWKPYMHNPKLRRRLSRISIPTLVAWGESDRIVDTDYGRCWAEAIPGARFELIEAAGHAPDVEQPERLADLAVGFLGRTEGVTA